MNRSNRFTFSLAGAVLALASAAALAQPASAPAPAASRPGMGMGMHGMHGGQPGMPGGGKGMHRGPRATASNTPGWSLMTPEERSAHHDKMRGMQSVDDCKAYMTQHHEQMLARAKEKGQKAPAMPRRDPCAVLAKP